MSGGDKLDFEIRPNPAPVSAADRAALLANPGFGRVFTDHMVTIRYAEGKGWYDARLEARAPIPMDPAAAVLHYAQEIFEGLKAYRTGDAVTMFRPEANAARFSASARRLAMPELPEATFVESLRRLVEIDQAWIPAARGRQPLPASVHVRQRGLPRRAPGQRIPLLRHRLAGRGVLLRRGEAGDGLGLAGLHPGRARRHRRGEVRRQLRRLARGAGRGDRGAAATRWSSWTRSSGATSTSWAA